MTAPNGVKSKKPKPAKPACWSAPSATRFGGVPTSVSMPLISPAKLSGIISRPGASFCRSATSSTTGMKIATTPVELMIAPSPETGNHEQHEQPPFAPAGTPHQEIADLVRHSRAHQPFADDEEHGDEHDIRIAESRQRFRYRDDPGERQRHHREQRDHIHARFVHDEQRHACTEQAEDENQLRIHARLLFERRPHKPAQRKTTIASNWSSAPQVVAGEGREEWAIS
jgi:hypothetical protein